MRSALPWAAAVLVTTSAAVSTAQSPPAPPVTSAAAPAAPPASSTAAAPPGAPQRPAGAPAGPPPGAGAPPYPYQPYPYQPYPYPPYPYPYAPYTPAYPPHPYPGAMAPPVDPGPRELPYYGGTVEEGYHLETKYSKAAVLGGGVTFLGLYGITAIFAGSLGARGDGNAALALIPVAGPAISIGGYDFRGSLAGLVILAAVGMAFNTLAQAAGLGFFIYGIASPKQVQMKGPPKQEAMPALRFDARGPALVF